MTEHERRGVSVGTVLMLATTVLVLVLSAVVLPQLMGSPDLSMKNRAMLSSTNLNDSLPELSMKEIPISIATQIPELPATPTPAPAPSDATGYVQATVVPTEPPARGTVMLSFAGSVIMDRDVRQSGYFSESKTYDFSENLSLIASELDSDYTMLTLESITDSSGDVRSVPNAPAEAMDMLANANVDMVALGWDYALDRGLKGAAATISEAKSRGMETLGLYESQEDAARIRMVDIRGVNVAYMHYSTTITPLGRENLKSSDAKWALPVITIGDAGVELIASDIRSAREAGAKVVVVSINWSGSKTLQTNQDKMKNFMQGVADAGADLIVGSGTRAIREITWLTGTREDGSHRQTLCAWSLGCLITGEKGDDLITSMLLHVQMSVAGDSISFERVSYTPTFIWRFRTAEGDNQRYRVIASDRPVPDGMDETQAATMEKTLEKLKIKLGTSPVTLRTK